jgi:hypothetical protein
MRSLRGQAESTRRHDLLFPLGNGWEARPTVPQGGRDAWAGPRCEAVRPRAGPGDLGEPLDVLPGRDFVEPVIEQVEPGHVPLMVHAQHGRIQARVGRRLRPSLRGGPSGRRRDQAACRLFVSFPGQCKKCNAPHINLVRSPPFNGPIGQQNQQVGDIHNAVAV